MKKRAMNFWKFNSKILMKNHNRLKLILIGLTGQIKSLKKLQQNQCIIKLKKRVKNSLKKVSHYVANNLDFLSFQLKKIPNNILMNYKEVYHLNVNQSLKLAISQSVFQPWSSLRLVVQKIYHMMNWFLLQKKLRESRIQR